MLHCCNTIHPTESKLGETHQNQIKILRSILNQINENLHFFLQYTREMSVRYSQVFQPNVTDVERYCMQRTFLCIYDEALAVYKASIILLRV